MFSKRNSPPITAAAGLLLLFVVQPVFAQEASDEAVLQQAADEDESAIERMVVTGSRIERTGTMTPTPVTILDSAELALNGDVRLADTLNELPAIRPTQTTGNVNTSGDAQEAGTNFLNLRGLGIDRTLVLIDGRRHVGSRTGSAAVDINTIPTELVERVEVVTGGASAVYGADAVSGVINIITKDRFEGLSINAQSGIAEAGDGEQYQISVMGGSNLADDSGNVWFNASFDRSRRAEASERGYASRNLRFAPNPSDTGPNDGVPAQVLFDNTGFIGTPAGGQVVGPNGELFRDLGGPFTFDANGNLVPQDEGTLVLPFLSQGGDFVDLSQFDLLAVPVERTIIAGGLDYDLTDRISFFAEGKFAQTESRTDGQPTFNLGFDLSASGIPGAFIEADNPFVPQSLRDVLVADGLEGFFVGRTNVDHGGRKSLSDRDTLQLYVGVEGELTRAMDFSLHYQWGRTDNTTEFINERINSRFLQQIDAVTDANGNIVCRDPSNGCVPLNLLGPTAATPEAVAFSHVDFVTEGQLTQQVVNGTITGDTGSALELPGGSLGYAFGFEYRDEESVTEEGFLRNTGAIFATAPVADTEGSFDVWEGFAEATFPLISGAAFAEEINLEAAARFADYSTIGNATTWKVGGDWMPVNDVRFRATISEAVRAPNIGELFASVEQSNLFINDPCDADFVDAGGANRADNCAALGLGPDFQSNSEAFTKAVFSGGNPDLEEETADTFTAGFVLTPRFLQGFSLTVDYWDIEIEDAINSFPAQAVVNGCVDSDSIDNPLCDAVSRGANGNIETVSNQLINIASFEASGIDFEARYRLELGRTPIPGALDLGLTGTWLDKLDFFAQEGQSQPDEEAGELGDPELQLNMRATWQHEDWTVSVYERFLSSQDFDLVEPDELRSPNDTGGVWYTDLQARYSFSDRIELYGGINNAFDREPPDLALVPETRAFGDDAILYDQIGRFFYAGLRIDI
jgi:iron complex outermembrane recepter protein